MYSCLPEPLKPNQLRLSSSHMLPMNTNTSNQMQLMARAARERLRVLDPAQIAQNADVLLSDNEISIESLSETFRLRLPEYEFDRDLEMWHCLTLLQYLFTADGTPLSGRWISLAEMPGGLSRGYGFDKDLSLMFERNFRDLNAAAFVSLCRRLGGTPVEGRSDASILLRYAPRFPILINFWESDDEFPCSGKIFVDANAHHYLTVEAAGGACAAALSRLIKQHTAR